MTKSEIRKEMKTKIKELGVKGAYQYIVKENAKVIKPQFPNAFNSFEEKLYLVQLAHSITVKGIEDAGMIDAFKQIFFKKHVLFDNVYDEILNDLIIIASK